MKTLFLAPLFTIKKILFSLVPVYVITMPVNGQDYTPKVIPPSPEAQKFELYTNYPAANYTGVPDISIPIYDIVSGNISLPISISYHASGLKPNEESGIVAMGWKLNAGGIITRSVIGEPDEQHWSDNIRTESSLSGTGNYLEEDSDAGYLSNVYTGQTDTQYDIFTYNLLNESGKFIFKKNSNLNLFLNPELLPAKPISITPNYSSSSFNYFNVIDEKGVFYRFGQSVYDNTTYKETYHATAAPPPYTIATSSWLLTEMISPDENDTIRFIYDDIYFDYNGTTTTLIRKLKRVYQWNKQLTGGSSTINATSIGGYSYTSKVIKEIRFKNGKLVFNYNSDFFPDNQISEILVFNDVSADPLADNPIKKIKFNQSLYNASTGKIQRYKLDDLRFYNSLSQEIKKYSFAYYDDKPFPSVHDSYTGESRSIDYLGFYNGKTNNGTYGLISDCSQFSGSTGCADRSPDVDYMKTGVLKEIHYPTGGYTSYEYEVNGSASGLRINKVTNITGNESIVRSYGYGSFAFAYGPALYDYTKRYYQSTSGGDGTADFHEWITISSETSVDLYFLNGSPVIYQKVIEYLGETNDNQGKIEHTYDLDPVDFSFEIDYDDVLGYPFRNPPVSGHLFYDLHHYQSNYRYSDILETVTEYFNFQNGSYSPVKKIENKYEHELKSTINGLIVDRKLQIPYPPPRNKVYHFNVMDYTIEQVWQKLDTTIVYEYSPSGTTTTVKKYFYENNSHLQPTKLSETYNSNSKLFTKILYPLDYSNTTGFIGDMKNRHIVSAPIEIVKYKEISPGNSKVISGEINVYGLSNKASHLSEKWILETQSPITLSSFSFSNQSSGIFNPTNENYVQRVILGYNGSGRLIRSQQVGGLESSYIWGYDQTYPIAKIIHANMDYFMDYVAYTSFETEDDKGGWSFTYSPGSNVSTTVGKTGKRSFTGGNIYKWDISMNIDYKLSFWARKSGSSSGTVTIDGSAKPIDNSQWEYHSYILDISKDNIKLEVSGAYVDELRLHPVGAQMTTYTYDPLIGMTSATDENGQPTIYKYDPFGRLEYIKDQDGAILQKNKSHYQQ